MGRTLKTVLFLTPAFVPITLLGGIFGLNGTIIGLVVSFILCLLIVFNVDGLALHFYKARPVLPGDLSEIQEKIIILSSRAGVPVPSTYITGLPLPGSFIFGKNPDKTALVIPERLLGLLKIEEFEAMLAYNIVQINNTISLRTLAALITGIFTTAATAVRWGAVYTGFGSYNDPAPRLFGLFITGLASPPAAAMIHAVTEQEHDAEAAALCKNPAALISAIERLENNNVTGYPSLGFICLIDPEKENCFEHLFRMHQSKETRIKNLIEKEQKDDRAAS